MCRAQDGDIQPAARDASVGVEVSMKIVILGAALLACAMPAFGQAEAAPQSLGPVSGTCEAALISPGVPGAIVVITTPGDGGPARPLGPRAHARTYSRPSLSAPDLTHSAAAG